MAWCSARPEELAHLRSDARSFRKRGHRELAQVAFLCTHAAGCFETGDEAPHASGRTVWFGDEHRRARRAGFGHHVDRVGRDDEAIGPGERTGVEILAVVIVHPDCSRTFAV